MTRRVGSRRDYVIRVADYEREMDRDAERALEEACERTTQAVMDADPAAINALHDEFAAMWLTLMDEQDLQSADFITVLQGMLKHEVIPNAANLKGPYLRAYKRLYNAMKEMDWDLAKEVPERLVSVNAPVKETEYYDLLDVSPSSSRSEIRTAYRKMALEWHPDTSKQENAESTFLKIRQAYDVLSDPKSRQLYDQFGSEGMKSMPGARAGAGNADRFWDEFKPVVKQRRGSKARTAGAERQAEESISDEPLPGDVVEYPLSDVVKSELQDGRLFGVGLLVGRNKDRADATNLAPELLSVCEIEPLRQEEAESSRWMPDELGVSAFCNLENLKKIKVEDYDPRFDVWTIESELSEGCGGPEIVEEIVL